MKSDKINIEISEINKTLETFDFSDTEKTRTFFFKLLNLIELQHNEIERFISNIVEEGISLLAVMAYVDLNAVSAGIVKRPEDYRWSGLGYWYGTHNRDHLIAEEELHYRLVQEEYLDSINPKEELSKNDREKVQQRYLSIVYHGGNIERDGKRRIDDNVFENALIKDFKKSKPGLFLHRTRYFIDGLVIGSKEFIRGTYKRFEMYFQCKREKKGILIFGRDFNLYSLRRLSC